MTKMTRIAWFRSQFLSLKEGKRKIKLNYNKYRIINARNQRNELKNI